MANSSVRPKRTASFKIEFSGDTSKKNVVLNKLQKIKTLLKQTSSADNTSAIEAALDCWLSNNDPELQQTTSTKTEPSKPASYVPTNRTEVDQPLFLSCQTSIQSLVDRVQGHRQYCNQQLIITTHEMFGHASVIKLSCARLHHLSWASSSYLPNGNFLVNYRFYFGYTMSGMIPSQYERLCEDAGIGRIGHSAT